MDLKYEIGKNAPSILTALNVVGVLATASLTAASTVKAVRKYDELKQEEKDGIDIPKIEYVKSIAPLFIPPALMGGMTITCSINSNRINLKRTAVYAGAYALAESAGEVYKKKVLEKLGEKKEEEIRDEIAKDKLAEAPKPDREIILGEDEVLCYESASCRYFKSTYEKLREVKNTLNERLINEMYVSLNDLYEQLGLSYSKLGDDLGWNINEGLIAFDISTQLSEDNKPCIVLSYNVAPRYDYYKLG